jgi:hypothetical protein
MRRNVFILQSGQVVATIPVELDDERESEFVAEAIKYAIRDGTLLGQDLKRLDFQVSNPLASDNR